MSNLRKLADARKAAILGAAEEQVAQVERDLAQLGQLAAKYGLTVVDAAATATAAKPLSYEGNPVLMAVARALETVATASITAKARTLSEAYIRAKNRPVTLGELHDMLESQGVKFAGDTPRNTLSAILGQTPTLYSISRDKGWWLKDVPEPMRRV